MGRKGGADAAPADRPAPAAASAFAGGADDADDRWEPGTGDAGDLGAPTPGGGENAADPGDPAVDAAAPFEAAAARTLLAWAARYGSIDDLAGAVARHRAALATLRADDATLSIATSHGTKGLEWDHVAVIGLDAGRFPSARSVSEAVDPQRALEEERRLAYVAWTRARRTLSLLYDPGAPSEFLLEAFTPLELGMPGR